MIRDKIAEKIINYLSEETIKGYGSETPAAKELNDRFDFKKYYNEYLTKLDERFVPWDELRMSGGDIHFPNFRDNLTKGIPEIFEYSVILSREPMSTFWYVQENVSYKNDFYNSGEEIGAVVAHKMVDFHRIITKLFKGKELSVDEAVAELKEIVGDEN